MKIISLVLLIILTCGISAFGQTEVETLIKKSEEFRSQGKFTEAVDALSKAVELQPDDAFLYFRLYEAHIAENNKDAAIADVKKAAALAPYDWRVAHNSALFFMRLERCNEALYVLNNYISKDSTDAGFFSMRSEAKVCLKDFLGAYDDLSEAIERAPLNNVYRSAQMALLPQLGQTEKAFKKFGELIAAIERNLAKSSAVNNEGLKSELSQVYAMRSGLYHTKGDIQAEFADLAKFVDYEPKFYTYQIRAWHNLEHDRYEEAIADYTQAIRLAEFKIGVLVERGETYIEMKKYAEAAKDFEEALKFPNLASREILNNRLAWIKQKMAEEGRLQK